MAQKHLKELLNEDQEPFHLNDYIAHKQCLLKKQPQKTQIQLKKSKPVPKNSSFSCKNACFFSLQNSPEPRKSPLFDFASSVAKSPNRVFLHVPAKTAALLLEAAMRIQKPKTQSRNSGFGLFGSIVKRLTHRNRTRKLKTGDEREAEEEENRGEIVVQENQEKLRAPSSTSSSSLLSSSSSYERQSSLDLESSSSGRSFNEEEEDDDDEGFAFANVVRENVEDFDLDYGLCLSPLSPFRFALRRSPSPDRRRSPVFSSPAKSPARCKFEDHRNNVQGSPTKLQEEDDEEDKEQNSPVSILDSPFEDDDYDGHDEDDDYGVECGYAVVQRAKQHLLHKLHNFERLSELDPIELEKRMMDEEDNIDEELVAEQTEDYEEDYPYESFTFEEQRQVDEFIDDIITKSGFQDMRKHGMKRLVSDLIIEEESIRSALESDEQIVKRVCKRLGSWEEVESNTIDMMVEIDLRRETSEWNKPQEQIGETASDIEVAIFKVLVTELLEDLFWPA